ncbi:28S ribosomal protein S29, mitochondrial isoform X2 [Ceratina calcarata]|uniref:Small ribosomal subunit protein mS29 n=1 Tax=Ceratina calcarata TaxID=156304 RepID=A0AAJ7WCL5_9HYME|nr:28S ribosomal protein S29, mitochondrial isoform X2 [Ceratina calcarata]
MISYTYSSLSRLCIASGRRTLITAAAKEIQDTNNSSLRLPESFPPEHDESCLNRIFTIPSDITALLKDNLPIEFRKQESIFRELGILVRKPAVELISYLEQTDFTKPINKYILYGKYGTGKTATLIHLMHYGLAKHFILLHLPWVCTWFRFAREIVESPLVPGKLDIPPEAASWLKYFKQLNQVVLSQLDLKLSNDYNWSQKESIKSGDTLINLIEFGIQRHKFACGVIDALVCELKAASTAGKCKTLVIMDGFNAFTSNVTLIRDDTRTFVPPERISITSSFFNSVKYDWCNAAAILTVDTRANKKRVPLSKIFIREKRI